VQASEKVSEPAAVAVIIEDPVAGCVPLHAPLATQLVPLFEDHVIVADWPAATDAGLTFTVTAAGIGVDAVLPPYRPPLPDPPQPTNSTEMLKAPMTP
jgi:hypothetical protein